MAACTATPVVPEAGEGATAEQPSTEATAKAGELEWGTSTEPDTLDHQCTFSSNLDFIYKTMFDTLVFWGPDREFYPALAESWEISDDFTSYTFRLKQGVTFHDGTPFNAEAVLFNLDRLQTAECAQGQVAAGRLGNSYESSETLDEYTIRINFSAPNPTFLNSADGLYFSSPAAVEQDGDDYGRNPVGTGPFIFQEWVDQSHLSVTQNPNYAWAPGYASHAGTPYLESITWRFIPESTLRVAALESGEIEFIDRVDADQYALVEANPDLVISSASRPGMPVGWMLNASLAPLDDINVRQAVGHAIDRELMLQTLFGGFMQAAYGPVSSSTFGYSADVESYFAYDPAEASRLLEEAGWADADGDGILDKDGVPLTLTLIDIAGAADRAAAWEFFQAQLREVGIDLAVEFTESGVVVGECHAAKRHICGLNWRFTEPTELRAVFGSANIGSGFNWTHYPDAEIDQLIDTAATEVDRAERADIYADLQRRIMDLAIFVPIWSPQIVHAAQSDFVDWTVLANPEHIWLYEAYIQQP
jgi:peptide/nickel transport system substrate-binding protein